MAIYRMRGMHSLLCYLYTIPLFGFSEQKLLYHKQIGLSIVFLKFLFLEGKIKIFTFFLSGVADFLTKGLKFDIII
jgi:hypothetical protein